MKQLLSVLSLITIAIGYYNIDVSPETDSGAGECDRIFEKHDHDDGADCEKIRDQRRDAVAEHVL